MKEKKELSIYIHIPFCVRKCLYCDFLSGPATKEAIDTYIEALCGDIHWYQDIFRHHKIRSIFLGGGTPSILNEEEITKLMTTLYNTIGESKLSKDAPEITIEVNPGTLTKEKADCYQRLSINRISMGLQSANEEELKKLGRIHTYDEFLHSYETARNAGFENISFDIMSGLPGQTMESHVNTLEKVLALKPEHLSVYSLIVEEGTPFYKMYGEGKGEDLLPGEDLDRAMYHKTKHLLKQAGLEQYEISNYAKPGYESRHNTAYWTGTPYIGLGVGASSYFENRRYHKESDFEEYKRLVMNESGQDSRKEPAVILDETLDMEDKMDEFMILGLRMTKGVSKQEFQRRFGKQIAEEYPAQLKLFEEEELLMEEDDKLYLSERGIDISNQVFMEFLRK